MSALILPVPSNTKPRSVVIYGGDAEIISDATAQHLCRLYRVEKVVTTVRMWDRQKFPRNTLFLTTPQPGDGVKRRLKVIQYDVAMCALRADLKLRAAQGGA